MVDRCDRCKFWDQTARFEGFCRKNAPVPYIKLAWLDTNSVWPLTAHDEWCGEFSMSGKAIQDARVLDAPIFQMKFSLRTRNALRNDGITLLGDLVKMSKEELLRTANLGRKSVNEIEEMLAKLGLKLSGSIEKKKVDHEG